MAASADVPTTWHLTEPRRTWLQALIFRTPATRVAPAHHRRRGRELIPEKIGVEHKLLHGAPRIAAISADHRIHEIDLRARGNPLRAYIKAQLFGRQHGGSPIADNVKTIRSGGICSYFVHGQGKR